MALISVIIPCYNVEKYIDRCMESVTNQTIKIENLEIILVNDASTDGTLDKLYVKQYLSGMTAIAVCQDDAIAPAKIMKEYADKIECFEIKAGFVDGGVLDKAGVEALAATPSKEVLVAKMMGSLMSSLYSFAYVLQAKIDKENSGEEATEAPAEAPAEA